MPPFTLTSRPDSSERLRPVTWTIWLAWVLVAALGPVLCSISATAFGKQISRDAEHPTLIAIGLVAIVPLALLAPPIMQGLVLRRIMPKLNVAFWFLGILLSGIVWLVLTQKLPIEGGFGTQLRLQNAARFERLAGTLNAAAILRLPWGPFLLSTFATSTLISIVPAWMLGAASGMRRATLLFLVAAIAGACVSGIVEQIYLMTVDNRPIRDWALNGMSWTQRFQILTVRGGVGAVWGATTAIVVVLMIRPLENTSATANFVLHDATDLKLMLIAPLLIAVLAPFAGYLAGPNGVVGSAPELRKALSLPQDRSQGEVVLAYSHNIAISVGHAPTAVIAPDGQTAIVRAVDHTLMQVELATGRDLQQLASALGPTERYSIAWSPNGRYLALRSNGADVAVPGTPYRRNQNRVRLYLLPDLKLAGEFSGRETACLDTYAREPMLFSRDSNSLWMACGQSGAPKPDDVMAVRLDVLTIKPFDIRSYGAVAANGQTGGLDRIGDSVWAWQFGPRGEAFRIHDLTNDRDIVMVAMPKPLIGSLTAQTGQVQIDDRTIRLNFCGVPPGALANAKPSSWICRTLTFDTLTGALIGSIDQGDHRAPNPQINTPQQALSGHGLRIEAFWRKDSKTGELVVRDSVTGRERQRIISIAQRLLQMSADGRWLLTAAIDGGDLRLYRVQP
ncbi:MAG: hypothetical protein Q7T45_26640 [Bradyrhizobium sp.]|uniref:hypothetical protein n=1 Tax=Bradyrhizobium sp. TaxID=376 RepID=UPI00271DF848|nr:hypothetical protein [Bradyrhizobium sp.]MDO8401390.1 hypothetical protein [Bradyrhizobium sp.]